jgi:hypothetical protein
LPQTDANAGWRQACWFEQAGHLERRVAPGARHTTCIGLQTLQTLDGSGSMHFLLSSPTSSQTCQAPALCSGHWDAFTIAKCPITHVNCSITLLVPCLTCTQAPALPATNMDSLQLEKEAKIQELRDRLSTAAGQLAAQQLVQGGVALHRARSMTCKQATCTYGAYTCAML